MLAFWLFIPAYVANPGAVLFGGGTPVDFGRKWVDGRRLLGDGKTWRGLFGGALTGVLVGSVQSPSSVLWTGDPFSLASFVDFMGPVAALSFGALLGDVLGSFLKRRLGMNKGTRAPILDQYDFVLGALILTGVAFPGWVAEHYIVGEGFYGLVLILALTPILHRIVNVIGYRIGRKEVPW